MVYIFIPINSEAINNAVINSETINNKMITRAAKEPHSLELLPILSKIFVYLLNIISNYGSYCRKI